MSIIIPILMLLMALLLFLISYYLLRRFETLFPMIENNPKNRSFFTLFGRLYAFLGLCGLVLAFLGQIQLSLAYLMIVVLCAAAFSLALMQKVKLQNNSQKK